MRACWGLCGCFRIIQALCDRDHYITKFVHTMARFVSFDDMVAFLEANPPINRMEFLRSVRFATLDTWHPMIDDHDMTRAIACAMAWGWIPRDMSCPVCLQASTWE